MKCEGHYDNDRICGLCYDTNRAVYDKCRVKTKEYKEGRERDVVMKFIVKHCKHVREYYAEGSDRYECLATEECDGYYEYCEPFGEHCVLGK